MSRPREDWLPDYHASHIVYWLEKHSFYPLRTETYDHDNNLSRIEVRVTKLVNTALAERGYSPFIQIYLVAREGGVLMRSGHTEACVDLCRLAGLPPVGVLAELINDDGSVMRGPQVTDFARRHGLTQVSIADLIAYRQGREKLVQRVAEFSVSSSIGSLQGYAFVTPFDPQHHMAFVYGRVGDGKNIPARLHRADVIGDVFGGAKAINAALSRFKADGRGVLVYLRDGTAGVPVASIPRSEATSSDDLRSRQWREVGLGAQILKDLGISSIRLLASSNLTYVGLGGFGIEIVATEK